MQYARYALLGLALCLLLDACQATSGAAGGGPLRDPQIDDGNYGHNHGGGGGGNR
jgi:hypothetical protein